MPDDETLSPPETPPGEPDGTAEPEKKVEVAPTFTREQVGDLVRESVRSVVTELTPKRSEPMADGPTGPNPAELQVKIDDIDNQIDQAASDGKPTRALLKARDDLVFKKYDAEYVQPLRQQGSQSINDLVLNQIGSDPEIGEIFTTYRDEVMTILTPGIKQGQPLRLDWVKEATRMVAGRHLREINDRDFERRTRKAKDDSPTPLPGGTNGRVRNAGADKKPETLREVYGERAEEGFRGKRNKGVTEDGFARTLGYTDFKTMRDKDAELSNNPTLGLDK
jgi:hypothetical protein